jgi:polyisoprenyl-phosphate glycosyltransferase
VGDFRLVDRKLLEGLRKINESNLFIRGIIPWMGYTQASIDYERDGRYAGKTKYSLGKMINLGLDGITSFSVKPLQFSLKVGLACIATGLGLALFAVVNKILNPEITIRGWPSLLLTVVFFGGVQLFTIGLLGEYVAKIYKETKRRPLYIIRKKLGFETRAEKTPLRRKTGKGAT